ncbi:hypothetical protein Vadar_031928 [Vaccinium darrowii]|uniref:Uncharacterized protein n=1 Tax=Vaccinium darrowii TaxID=229202 RepID=A0ACB7ZNX2_9ERIC|nr:hypothetical protein Vadar_031928 [Vaccinium darrowii]
MSLPTPTGRPSDVFTWKIVNFSKLKTKKLCSKTFNSGGYKWRVLIFPKGNNVEYLSVYLEVANSSTLPYGWNKHARFGLSVINQIRKQATVRKETEHQFNAQESDWGFTSFLPLKELNDPRQGFLLKDTIIVEADVTVPDSHCSNKETGENDSHKVESQRPSCDTSSENVEVEITGTSEISSVDGSSEATATAGKDRFLSYWVSSEAFQLLEKIQGLHKGTFAKFSMKSQALPTVILESFASFIVSMSSTKVNEADEEALRLAAFSIEDFEQVGLDLGWLKQRLEDAKMVKKYSESVDTVESCGTALEVARAKVRELEVEVMSRKVAKSVGANDTILKDMI